MIQNSAKSLAKTVYRVLPKRPLFDLLRHAGLPQQVYRHLHFRGPFVTKMSNGSSFKMMSRGEILENELFWSGYGGSFEGVSLKAWERLATTVTGAILDIGANAGVYSLAARAVNGASQLIAFEPVARIRDRLVQNVRLNGFRIEAEPYAISDKAGMVPIYDSTNEHNYVASLEASQAGNSISYEIEAIPLDAYLENRGWPRVALIKLDVERHEPAAIRGMAETIRRFRPSILIEVLDAATGAQILPMLDGLGYRLFNTDEHLGLIPSDRLRPLHGDNWNNLICTEEAFEAAGLADLLA